MNPFSQLLISATAGSLVMFAVTVSPLFAQNKTTTPTPPSNSNPVMPYHQQMINDISQMMEQCQSMMGNDKKPTGSQHNQHHPGNTKNPTNNLSNNNSSLNLKRI